MRNGQSSLEFTMAFVLTVLFMVLTVNLFVWLNHCMIRRQVAYENTRSAAGGMSGEGSVGKSDFYTPPTLNIFKSGGR